jgi:hypothetical protein
LLNTGDQMQAFRDTFMLLGAALVVFGLLINFTIFSKVRR